jgi:hypothetical protein
MMPRKVDDRVRLLHGPYRAPRLRVGDRADCLFRDCLVVVTGWTDARISWPRCRPLDVPRSHPSLLVDDELARAVRQESAAAVRWWWGVSVGVVWRWRKALGVTRATNEGSRRLIRAAAEKGAAAQRGVPLPAEQVERRRQTALELDLGRTPVREPRPRGPPPAAASPGPARTSAPDTAKRVSRALIPCATPAGGSRLS